MREPPRAGERIDKDVTVAVKRHVIDTNYLGHDDLAAFLGRSTDNHAVIAEMTLVEVHSVHAGRRIVAAEVAQQIALHTFEEPLTERERAILLLVAEGKANKEIARLMTLAPDTIKASLKTIYLKLNVGDRTQAVVMAVRRGHIEL